MAKKLITHIDRDNASPSSKVSLDALEASLGAFTTDSENRTVWIDGMPYGNAYIAPNTTGEDPIHSEVFNDFDRENGNKAFGDYSHAEGTGTKTFSKGSHAEGINTTAGLRGFSFAVYDNDKQAWKSCVDKEFVKTDGKVLFDCEEGDDSINNQISTYYSNCNTLSVLNGKVYTDCIEIVRERTRSGTELSLKISEDYVRRGINPFADTFYEVNQYSNFLIWSAERPTVGNVDIGFGSHAEGVNTFAYGTSAHAEGTGTWAAESAHSEGVETGAYGVGAHAEGSNSIANANNTHAEGQSTFANGHNSHTEGRKTVADGNQAHAEGIGTKAQGYNSHSEGNNTTAVSNSAHAEGIGTIAGDIDSVRGRGSHAEGIGTRTQNDGEHAEGRYNYTEHGIISSIGVGVDGTPSGRKNAITVNDAGQVFIASVNEIVGNVVNKYDPCSYDGHSVKSTGVKSLQRILTEAEKKQIPVTYAELLNLKENSLLIPGNYYQITDYVTSLHPILEDKAKSAGHKFDLIVTALSENEISENASCKSNNDILESNLRFSDGIVSSKTGETIELDVFTIKTDNSSYPIYNKTGIFTPTTYDVNTANLSGLKNISGETEYVIIHGDLTIGNTTDTASFIYDFNNDIFCNNDISFDENVLYIDQLNKHRFIQCTDKTINVVDKKTWDKISSINISIPFTVEGQFYPGNGFLYADLHFVKTPSNDNTYIFTPTIDGSKISIYKQEKISVSPNLSSNNNSGWGIVYNRDNNSSQVSTFAVNGWGNGDSLDTGLDNKTDEVVHFRPSVDLDDLGGGWGGGTGGGTTTTTTTTTSAPPKDAEVNESNLVWTSEVIEIDTYWEDILSKFSIKLISGTNDTFNLYIYVQTKESEESIANMGNINNGNKVSLNISDITSKDFVKAVNSIVFDSNSNPRIAINLIAPTTLSDGVDYRLKVSNVIIDGKADEINFSSLAASTKFIFIDDVDIINNKIVLKTTEYIKENKEYYNNTSTVYNLETTKVKYCHDNIEANNRFGTVVLGTNIKEHIEYAAYKDIDEGTTKTTPTNLVNTLSYFSLGTLYSDNLMPPGANFSDAALSGFENEADFSKYTFRWDSCTTINDTTNDSDSDTDAVNETDNKEKLNYHNDYCILTSSKDSLGKTDSTFFAVLCEKDTTKIINENNNEIKDSASNTINISEVFKNSSNFTQATLNISKIGLNGVPAMATVESLVNVPELQYNEYGQAYTPTNNPTHIKWVSNKYPSWYFETISTGDDDKQSTDISIFHTFGTQKYSLLGSEKNLPKFRNYFEGVETHTFDIADNDGKTNDQTIINRVKIIHTIDSVNNKTETIDYWIKLDNETNQPITYNFQKRFNESILTTLLANKLVSIGDDQLSSILSGDWYIYESICKTLPQGYSGHGDNLVIENSDVNGKPYCNTDYHKSVNDIVNELTNENKSSYCYGKFYVICKLTENKQLVEKITVSEDKEIPLAFLVKRDMKTTFNVNGSLVSPCSPVSFYDGVSVNNSPLTTKFNFNDYHYDEKGTANPVPRIFLFENENYFYGLTAIPTKDNNSIENFYYLTGSEETYTGNLAGIQYSTKLYNPFTLYFEDTAYSRYICEYNPEQSIIFNKDKDSNIASSICKRVAVNQISNYYSDDNTGQLPVYLYSYLKKIRDIGTSTIYASSIITYKLPFYYSRGFIYDMEDQYRNVLPYDFTNILQKIDNKWYYTFSTKDNQNNILDSSILGCVRNSKIITSSVQNLFNSISLICESSDSRINNAIISSSNNVIVDDISAIDGLQIKSCNNVNISVSDISNSELSLLTNVSSTEDKSLIIDNSIISNLTNKTLQDTSYINRFIRDLRDDEKELSPVFSVNNFRVYDNTSTDIIESSFYNTSSSIASINTGTYDISGATSGLKLDRKTGNTSNDDWNHCRNSVTAQISFKINKSSPTTVNNINGKPIYKLIDNKYLDLGYIVVGAYYKYSDHNYSKAKYAPDIWYRFNPTITVTGAINGTISISGKIDSELVWNASRNTSYYRYFGFKPSIDISQLSLDDASSLLTYNGQTYLSAGSDIITNVIFNPYQIYVGSQNDAGGTKGVDPRLSVIKVYSNTETTNNPMYSSYLKNGERNTIYTCSRGSVYTGLTPNETQSISIDIHNANSSTTGNIDYGLEQTSDITKNLLVAVCQDGFVTKSAQNIYSLTQAKIGGSNSDNKGTRTVYGSIINDSSVTSGAGFAQ